MVSPNTKGHILISDEKRKKIIDKIVSDKVPKNVDKMF